MSKLVRVLICSLLAFGFLFNAVSLNVKAESDPFSTVEQLTKYENAKQWLNIPSLWSLDQNNILKDFLSNKDNELEHLGLFNIKKAKIVQSKVIDNEFKYLFPYLKEDSILYYYAVDYQVHREDKYHMNGINYYLVELVKENSEWKISQLMNAPVDIISTYNLGFNTEDEKEMIKTIKKRYKGIFTNRENKILETNRISDSELLAKRSKGLKNIEQLSSNNSLSKAESSISSDVSILTTADHVEPSSIDVYITSDHNYNYYKCRNCVKDVGFTYYVKNVLPNEWVSSWHSNSLKTGAACVKMYGWYAVYYPLASSVNADLYDSTRDQVYKINSELTSTNNAVNGMDGIGVHRKDNQSLFLTQYIAGTQGSTGTKASGKVEQWGSKLLAEQGKYVNEILGYYYNGSSKVGGSGKVFEYFVY